MLVLFVCRDGFALRFFVRVIIVGKVGKALLFGDARGTTNRQHSPLHQRHLADAGPELLWLASSEEPTTFELFKESLACGPWSERRGGWTSHFSVQATSV